VTVARWVYRAAQFRKALAEQGKPLAREVIEACLDPREQALFHQMSRRDQVHSINTATLVAGHASACPDLLVAALLHDAGKGEQSIWQRALYVVLTAVSPAAIARFARPGGGTRGALHRSLNHASLGAARAAEAGCSEKVCRLIAGHHKPESYPESGVLQWADELA